MRPRVLMTLISLVLASSGTIHFDVFDKDGNRKGKVVERTPGNFDLFDKNSNRLGYGRVSPYDGKTIEFFDPQGRRLFEIRRDRPASPRRP